MDGGGDGAEQTIPHKTRNAAAAAPRRLRLGASATAAFGTLDADTGSRFNSDRHMRRNAGLTSEEVGAYFQYNIL